MGASSEEMVEHIPDLQRFAKSLTHHPDRADDLVQDCLERAIERRSQFQSGTNLRAWLFKIMHSIYIDDHRKRIRRGASVTLDEWRPGLGVPATQQSAVEMREFGAAIRTLPSASREILMLVGAEGLSYDEASSKLDVPIGTVRSRLSRARNLLRQAASPTASDTGLPAGGAGRPASDHGERAAA